MDDQAPDAAGRAALRSPVELVPRQTEPRVQVLPGRDLPADRWRDRLQRHHAAHGCRVRRLRQRQDGAEGEPRKVPAGRQRQQPRVQREPGAADPVRQRTLDHSVCVRSVRSASTNRNFIPDCNLANSAACQLRRRTGRNDDCGQIDNLQFGSSQLVGARIDPGLFSGWGVRPSDWSFGVSVQQELFPRASVEVGYYRRSFTHVHDEWHGHRQPVGVAERRRRRSPDGADRSAPARRRRIPDRPAVRRQPERVRPGRTTWSSPRRTSATTRASSTAWTSTITVRGTKGFTSPGGTSTGKVENDWCAVRTAVPETYLLNPYCQVESPWQTSFRALATYTIPRIDVLVSSVFQDKPNVGTDQIGSLAANYTLTAADLASAAAQFGRPLTQPASAGEPARPGPDVRRSHSSEGSVVEEDHPLRRSASDGRRRLYNLMNNNVTLGSTRRSCRTRRGG